MFVHIPRCCNEGGVCATDQKCPYHESAEVFYGSDMTHPPTICLSPEDLKCSGGLTMPISIDDHTHYFGVQVGSYCKEAPEQMWTFIQLIKRSERETRKEKRRKKKGKKEKKKKKYVIKDKQIKYE